MQASEQHRAGAATRVSRVKNKAAAEVQITAEQLLREASERSDLAPRPVRQKITDGEESGELKQAKRKGFEDAIRRNRTSIGTWLKYASWEEQSREFARARSIYERVLEIEPRNVVIWLKYAEMEMKNRNVDLARNVWNRAVTLLPYVEQFWYKYAYFEEMLGNVAGARQIFERWMEWEPKEAVWSSYVKLERRYKEYDRVRQIFERLVFLYPTSKNWIKYAKFEDEINQTDRCRAVYERGIETLTPTHCESKLFVAFAKFEIRHSEIERARIIFKFGLESLPKPATEALTKQYIQFEKQFGARDDMEWLILGQRRESYESQLKENPRSYDVWFDYLRLEESSGTADSVRALYERAVLCVPVLREKKYWRRYVYLWIYYAVYEELEAEDMERTRTVYKRALEAIPHGEFTFAKIWDLYAKFLVRRMELTTARRTLGAALGRCAKPKLYKNYIELELELREFDRCRTLYQKYLMYKPSCAKTWIRFAELEKLLGDDERARAVYELAISQPGLELDIPELVWKSFIDFEYEGQEYGRARALYERLLQKTEHVKVWISYAAMEAAIGELESARHIYDRGYQSLRSQGLATERLTLLESWAAAELSAGHSDDAVRAKFPRQVYKTQAGSAEQVLSLVFPDDVPEKPHSKFLEMAHQWQLKREKDASEATTSEATASRNLAESLRKRKSERHDSEASHLKS